MMNSPALSRILVDAVPFEPYEAVAIAQQSMANRFRAGTPVHLSDVAALLRRLLLHTRDVPPALWGIVARTEQDALEAGFETPLEISEALRPFETTERMTVVRDVLARAQRSRRRRVVRRAAVGVAAASVLIVAGAGSTYRMQLLHRDAPAAGPARAANGRQTTSRTETTAGRRESIGTTGTLAAATVARRASPPPVLRAV